MKISYSKMIRRRPSATKINKRNYERLKRLWRDAIQVYLRAIALEGVIKVDTGMSKASLLPLARAVRMLGEVRATISPQRPPTKGMTDISGTYHPNRSKSVAEGERAGQGAFNISYGNPKRIVFHFSFETRVYQYFLHEIGAGGKSAWNSLEIGRAAMLEFIRQNWTSYADMEDFRWLITGE